MVAKTSMSRNHYDDNIIYYSNSLFDYVINLSKLLHLNRLPFFKRPQLSLASMLHSALVIMAPEYSQFILT